MTEIKEEKIVKKIEWKLGFGSGLATCRVCNKLLGLDDEKEGEVNE